MNRKQRNWIIGVVGLIVIVGIAYWVLIGSRICCALPPTPPTLTAQSIRATASLIVALNQTTEVQLQETETYALLGGFQGTMMPSSTASFPYDPTLYAQRQHEAQILQTAGGPDDYATFYAEETALVATYQRTIIPITPLPYEPTLYAQRRHEEQILQTGAGPTQYAIFFATETALAATYQGTVLPTSTPIPYTADMSPTAIPHFNTRTATPTLCPPSDVVCPGGNATMSPADKVMMLMASASAPEFGQLAQTATALAITPTPTATPSYPQCIWTWARQDLPDVTEAAQSALTEAGLKNITVRSEAYGENCLDSRNNKVAYFAAMTTDFYLSANVSNLNDNDELAQIVESAYKTLTSLNIELPAQIGYFDIVFTAGEQQKRFRAMFSQIKPLIEAGKSAAELLAVGNM